MAKRLNIALKVLLFVLIAISLIFVNAERFSDKATPARAVAYPLLCAVPAGIWWLIRPGRPTVRYPHLADALTTAPFVIDLGGNALNLFDTLGAFDDILHFLNWFLLGLAIGVALPRSLPGWARAWMVAGFGALAAVIWEVAEFSTFVLKVEQVSIYRDTLGDLSLGSSGALLAGVLLLLSKRPTPAD